MLLYGTVVLYFTANRSVELGSEWMAQLIGDLKGKVKLPTYFLGEP